MSEIKIGDSSGSRILRALLHSLDLYYDHPLHMNDSGRREKAQTIGMMTAAVQAGSWEECLWTMPRPYRPEALTIVEFQLSDCDYWRLLGELWTDTEFPGRQQALWLYLFSSSRPGREQLMESHDLAHYQALPREVTLYRGARPRWARGLSWTLSIEVGARFARRFNFERGRIYRATVERSQIMAYFSDRDEDEIVIDPRRLPPLRAMCLPSDEIDAMAEREQRRIQDFNTKGFAKETNSE
jgi:hypothetical protein